MRILADENIDAVMVSWLRRQGHDVVWAAESLATTNDSVLLELANRESRILLTRDLDFGELIYREGYASCGIILLRLWVKNQHERLECFSRQWPEVEKHAEGHFLVVRNSRLRVRKPIR